MKVLIFGLPGSGKTSLAEPFAKEIGGVWINADTIRKKYNDWDFSTEGRERQAFRMSMIADGVVAAGRIAVCDFVCPTEETRKKFGADFTVWMDTIKAGRYEDTNAVFEKPLQCDYHVADWFDNTHETLMLAVERYQNWKNKNV